MLSHYPFLVQQLSPKNKDILLYNHSIAIKITKLILNFIISLTNSIHVLLRVPIVSFKIQFKDCILHLAVSLISQFGKLPVFPFLSWPWHFLRILATLQSISQFGFVWCFLMIRFRLYSFVVWTPQKRCCVLGASEATWCLYVPIPVIIFSTFLIWYLPYFSSVKFGNQ